MTIRSVFTLVGALVIACRKAEIAEGNYQRTAFVVTDDHGKRINADEELGPALPPGIRILPGSVYEVDARVSRIRGKYRLERDSIFFDDQTNAGTVVSMFGVAQNDTIQIRMPSLLMVLGAPPTFDLRIEFVRR